MVDCDAVLVCDAPLVWILKGAAATRVQSVARADRDWRATVSYFVAGEMERMWGDAEGLVQDAEAADRSGTHAEGSTVIGGDEGVDDWESFVRDYAAAELQRLWEAAELRCCTHRADAADHAAVVVGPQTLQVDGNPIISP